MIVTHEAPPWVGATPGPVRLEDGRWGYWTGRVMIGLRHNAPEVQPKPGWLQLALLLHKIVEDLDIA